ncbi:hypothetical protein [Kitasatospora paranensis]|uniref:Uncharacterized protein n=1 Tax=Kitasatospora paranensis TaxID=258053 RepID=A0ABW2FXS1_9ACTN
MDPVDGRVHGAHGAPRLLPRAVRRPGPLDDGEMYERVAAMTGLGEEQLSRAVAWQQSRHS